MSNRAQEIIKAFYEEEAKRQESEVTFTDYTVRLNTSDIAMLEVIAKRFGKAADRIASEAVSAAVYSMVEALETSERKTMAKEADDLNETLAKKAAKANGKPEFDEKSVTWVMNDRAITREENKRKKEQEETKAKVEQDTNSEVSSTPSAHSDQSNNPSAEETHAKQDETTVNLPNQTVETTSNGSMFNS